MKPDTAKPRGLARTLAKLIDQAKNAGDHQYHETYLHGGLYIAIGINENFNLRLSRDGREPGAVEWRTVVAYLPEIYKPSQPVDPRRYISPATGRHCLSANWDSQKRLL